jgi:hypothetical protein
MQNPPGLRANLVEQFAVVAFVSIIRRGRFYVTIFCR